MNIEEAMTADTKVLEAISDRRKDIQKQMKYLESELQSLDDMENRYLKTGSPPMASNSNGTYYYQVLDYVKKHKKAATADIAKATGIRGSNVSKMLSLLVQDKQVKRVNRGIYSAR